MKRGLCRCLLAVSLILLLLTAVSASECNTKLVALTFDDGPCANTEQLLDGLAKRGAKATFFVQGVKAEQNEELIRRMLDEGHQVGNHSYDHPNLSSIPLEEAVEQLVRTDEILNEITGLDGEYPYRAPYGSSTAMLRRKMGAPFFKWSVDTLDWSVRHAWSIEQRLLNDIHDGAIILCHDTVHHTIDGALWAVDQLQEQGYEFVTIGELFRRRGVVTDRYEDLYSCLPVEEQLSAPEHPVVHVELFGSHAVVSAESQDGAPIYYTTDGAAILGNASVYNGSFSVEAPCTIRAVCAYDLNGGRSEEITLFVSAESDEKETEPLIHEEPDRLTRGFLAQLMYDLEEEQYVQIVPTFLDVPEDHPYAEAIAWSFAAGIFDGTGDGRFEPDRYVSREEVAKVLASMLGLKPGYELPDFPDAHKISGWAVESVSAVSEIGLLRGGSDGYFRPQSIMTGEEMKLVLERLEEISQ